MSRGEVYEDAIIVPGVGRRPRGVCDSELVSVSIRCALKVALLCVPSSHTVNLQINPPDTRYTQDTP